MKMPETLNTFFMGYPEKKIKSLQHVCNSLNLPITGTAETLRNRILKHVEDGKASDEEVREMARIFKENENKKKVEAPSGPSQTAAKIPATPGGAAQRIAGPCDHSTPTAFPQSQSLFSQERDGNTSNESGESILVDENEGDKVYEAVDNMYKEIAEITQNGVEATEDETMPDDTEKLKINVKKLEYLVKQSVEVMASKDHQICMLQESVDKLQGSVKSLVSTCGQLAEKHDNDLEIIKKDLASIREEITCHAQSSKEKLDDVIEKVACVGAQIETGVESTKQSVLETQNSTNSSNNNNNASNIIGGACGGGSAGVSAGDSGGGGSVGGGADSGRGGESESTNSRSSNATSPNSQPAAEMIETTQAAVNDVNNRLRRIAGQPEQQQQQQQQRQQQQQHERQSPRRRKRRIVVADSNGERLIPNLLHEDNNVVIEKRYTIEEAKRNIPTSESEVTDVVMLVGLNNIKKPSATIQETIEKYDEVCKTYQTHFPKALIHIGSVAPSSEKCIRFNTELQNLARARNAPFISAQPMLEETSFGMRPKANMINGLHYTQRGIKLFANEIKRSLYGHGQSQRVQSWPVMQGIQNSDNNNNNNWPPLGNNNCWGSPAPVTAPVQELRRILSMAMSCLHHT